MNTSENKRWNFDPIDKIIFEDGLRIKSAYFDKDLDVMLILLSNGKILKRKISVFKRLEQAGLNELMKYEISKSGIHWPTIDEDLSLRGFLKEEMLNAVVNP
jgi:hypothetical protein